jgi:hypothetical protein
MEYITTKQRLEEVSVANLGAMDKGSFEDFERRAKETGLDRPALIIETVLREPSYYGVTEIVYPISPGEWDTFIADAHLMAEYTPVVHVVDGENFTAPI